MVESCSLEELSESSFALRVGKNLPAPFSGLWDDRVARNWLGTPGMAENTWEARQQYRETRDDRTLSPKHPRRPSRCGSPSHSKRPRRPKAPHSSHFVGLLLVLRVGFYLPECFSGPRDDRTTLQPPSSKLTTTSHIAGHLPKLFGIIFQCRNFKQQVITQYIIRINQLSAINFRLIGNNVLCCADASFPNILWVGFYLPECFRDGKTTRQRDYETTGLQDDRE